MFRKMRREKKSISEEEAIKVLEKCTFGTLSINDHYGYGVPLSYVYDDGHIYVHSATEGHKIDAILKDPKVSFTVVERDDIVPEKFTTNFKSVIAFGKAEIIEDKEEKRAAMVILCEKYSKGYEEKALAYIEKAWDQFHAIKIKVEHLTGKGAK